MLPREARIARDSRFIYVWSSSSSMTSVDIFSGFTSKYSVGFDVL